MIALIGIGTFIVAWLAGYFLTAAAMYPGADHAETTSDEDVAAVAKIAHGVGTLVAIVAAIIAVGVWS